MVARSDCRPALQQSNGPPAPWPPCTALQGHCPSSCTTARMSVTVIPTLSAHNLGPEIEANGAITRGSVSPVHTAQPSSLTYIPSWIRREASRPHRTGLPGRKLRGQGQESGCYRLPLTCCVTGVGHLTSLGLCPLQSARAELLHLDSRISAPFKVGCLQMARPRYIRPLEPPSPH